MEDSHPAIIAPEQFALEQDIFTERSRDPKHSGATIFSGKIRCGCCCGWFGSKVWHSDDKYHSNSELLFKNKKQRENPEENRAVFYNTHPAIIEPEVFDKVQEIQQQRHRRTKTG